MQIGLIGGIGPAATDYYYRSLISAFAKEQEALELTIVHADTPTLLRNLEIDDAAAQVQIYTRLTERLSAAGAGCVVVTSIAGHFCIEDFKSASQLPVIDMLSEVDATVDARGLKKVGILGTRTVMTSKFYGALKNVDVLAPDGAMLDDVHAAYVSMAAAGYATDEQRAVFDKASNELIGRGAVDAVLLGGTDLALVYNPDDTRFPIVDCARIHVEAIVRAAISS